MSSGDHVVLPDGRRLGYAEYGDAKGEPLLFFPGTPHSRLWRPWDEDGVRAAGLRFITVERPGFGISDYQTDRTLLDWPSDVGHLADALGIDRFLIAGSSGGGPYVAACGFAISERVRAAAIVAGFGPLDLPGATRGMAASRRAMAFAFRRAPRLTEMTARLLPLHKRPATLYGLMARGLSEQDRQGTRWQQRIEDVSEALRPGIRGLARELRIVTGDWGFRLEDVAARTHLWHGEADVATPVAMGREMARRIPNCVTHFVPGGGHLLWETHEAAILSALTG